MSSRLDPAWLGLTVATIAWGFVVLWVQWPHLTEASGWWAIDSRRVLEATGVWLSGGDPYSIYGFVYAPFALLVALPFRIVGESGWFALEVAALAWIMLDASRGLRWPIRLLVVVAGALFLPAMSFASGGVTGTGPLVHATVSSRLSSALSPVLAGPGPSGLGAMEQRAARVIS